VATPRRDPHCGTEVVNLPSPRPAPGPVSQAPLAPAPPPVLPQPLPPPVAPAPSPAPKSGAAGATQYHAVGPVTTGVVGVLIGIGGKLKDEVYKVFDGENTIGRLPTAEVRTGERDDTISREHAQIIHREGAFGIKPLKENNPTYLNDEAIEGGAPLSDGDELKLGDSTFKFRVV
jgi:pSer/pThr/pTyr-binding forkhead associated (FHA) protein